MENSIFLNLINVEHYLISYINHRNLIEILAWFITIYVYFKIWKLFRTVVQSNLYEHDVFNSVYFPELLNSIPQEIIPSDIKLVDTIEKINQEVQILTKKLTNFPILGMDCEKEKIWYGDPLIHLIQLATRDGYCVLIKTTFLNDIPDSLSKLLSNADIWKVGVGIYNDANELSKTYKRRFEIKGTFDLRHLAHYYNIGCYGLKTIAKKMLNAQFNEKTERRSWTEPILTPDQIRYAAVDAYLGILLFEKFYEIYLRKELCLTKLSEHIKILKLDQFKRRWTREVGQQYRHIVF